MGQPPLKILIAYHGRKENFMRRMTNFWAFIKKLAGLIGFTGNKIEVGNDMEVDGDLEVNSSFKAASLTDGTTTKTMTEVLAGGGGVTIESGDLVTYHNSLDMTIYDKRWLFDGHTLKVFIVFGNHTGSEKQLTSENFAFMLDKSNLTPSNMSAELFATIINKFPPSKELAGTGYIFSTNDGNTDMRVTCLITTDKRKIIFRPAKATYVPSVGSTLNSLMFELFIQQSFVEGQS